MSHRPDVLDACGRMNCEGGSSQPRGCSRARTSGHRTCDAHGQRSRPQCPVVRATLRREVPPEREPWARSGELSGSSKGRHWSGCTNSPIRLTLFRSMSVELAWTIWPSPVEAEISSRSGSSGFWNSVSKRWDRRCRLRLCAFLPRPGQHRSGILHSRPSEPGPLMAGDTGASPPVSSTAS